MPLLSIITVNLNNLQGLHRTFESVFAQNFQDFEYIVIDGASIDGSLEFIESNASRIAFYTSEKDLGIFCAQNKGALKANGEYMLFLNSGDWLDQSDVLSRASDYLNGLDLLYGAMRTHYRWGECIEDMPETLSVAHFLKSSLNHPSTFIKRSLFSRMNGFREDFRIAADFEFFLRAVLIMNARCKRIPFIISSFDGTGVSSIPENQAIEIAERKSAWALNHSHGAF